MAETLRPLLADPAVAEAMGRAARRRAEVCLSVAREARAINAVYERLWATDPPAPRAGFES